MQMPILKPLTKEEYEYSERNKRNVEIQHDVKDIQEAINSDDDMKMKEIHMSIDGKYGAYIPDWGISMCAYLSNRGFYYDAIDKKALFHNLTMMKHKLEGYAMGLEKTTRKSYDYSDNNVSVTVNNSIENDIGITVSLTFEQARQKVENMTSLTDEQTRELLDKMAEIEKVVNESGTKKSKWEKIKPVLAWLADKSFDAGMTLLPLLLEVNN